MAAKVTLADKLAVKLRKLGLGERKANVIAKALMPLVRSVAKAEVKRQEEIKSQPEAEAEDLPMVPFRKGKVIKVNGHDLRLDLPVVPVAGIKGIELLRVMDGLCSSATYLVAAVRGDVGILAIRQLGSDRFNVKFYPTMAYWDKTEDDLRALGAEDFLSRGHYERMHFGADALDGLLHLIADEAKPKSRIKKLTDRFLAVTTQPLLKAFGYLSQRVAA